MISILIPHKSTPLNDMCLEMNLQMLQENTRKPYELILERDCPEPYRFWNDNAPKAKYDTLVFINSDMLMAPDWDINMVKHVDDNCIVAGYLVECGVIGVATTNIHMDFGRTPATFDRAAFEGFSAQHAMFEPEVKEERAWYMPCCMTKGFFERMGKYPCEKPFPYENDIHFWEHCLSQGAKLKRVNSFAYHFQNLSNPEHDHKRA